MKDVAAYSNSPSNPLETIYQLIAAIGRAERIEEIYEEALNGLQDTAAADRAAILLLDGDGVMRFKAWRGLSEQYRRAVESCQQGSASRDFASSSGRQRQFTGSLLPVNRPFTGAD